MPISSGAHTAGSAAATMMNGSRRHSAAGFMRSVCAA
jgi:hypothetical protein